MPKARGSGQLVSIDAIRGPDLASSAKRLLQASDKGKAGGVSTWDASSIFFELDGIRSEIQEPLSSQTLLLLYAADLRFRLRWQIEPALVAGQTIIAAPYVETGVAFGLATGLPERWVTEVFRFAPDAEAAFWLEGTPATSGSPTIGFLEFCNDDLRMQNEFFGKFTAHFDELERRGKCRRLS